MPTYRLLVRWEMAFSRAKHSRLAPRESTETSRAPLERDGQAEGVSKAMQFIQEYEARRALVSSDRNARPPSRPKRRHNAGSAQSPSRTGTRSRTVDRPTRIGAAPETSNRPRSRPRSSSAHRSKPVPTSNTGMSTSDSTHEPQAVALSRPGTAAYTSLAESRSYARELEKEVDRLRRELKAEVRGRLEDAARRDEVESSRSGSMQATVSKLRVQLDASKRREEQAQADLDELKKERGTVSDKEAENSALRAQLADVRAQAEADRRAAKAAQNSIESKLRDVILKQSYRNSPNKHGELSSAVDRRRVERDAETIVENNRRRSSSSSAKDAANTVADNADSNAEAVEHEAKRVDGAGVDGTNPVNDAPSQTVHVTCQQDNIGECELARLAAERDDAQEKLANLSKVCKALELKVANQDKRIRQLGEATASAEQNAQIISKERELIAIQKERLNFQLQRYRKKERKNNLIRSETSCTSGPGSRTSAMFDGVSDKVRTLAEELAKKLMNEERQHMEEYKETVAAQHETITKLNRKVAQLRVGVGKKAVGSDNCSAESSNNARRASRANISRSPSRDQARQKVDASADDHVQTGPSTATVQERAPKEQPQNAKGADKLVKRVSHSASSAADVTSNDTRPGGVDPELWASSVATALAFRAFRNGVKTSQLESLVQPLESELELEPEPELKPEPEPEPESGVQTQMQEQQMTGTESIALSPGDRLFKFATRSSATDDEVGLCAESDGSEQMWDIDITSANSVSFLGATLRGGRSPPRSSPVQMFDEGRLPRVGAGSVFAVAAGSI